MNFNAKIDSVYQTNICVTESMNVAICQMNVPVLKVLKMLKTVCKDGAILCSKDEKCLSRDRICNGVKDCSDGSDEVECTKLTLYCREQEFECLNEKCIPEEKVCNTANDCGYWSDEKRCLEKKCADFGGFCEDGTCIHSHQICDDVFNCLDFSDEAACKFSLRFRQPTSIL
ncbi:Low-density lipoprotein receptor-related protein 4 [Thelohanellus kitauei]|uniref:Low-density lipoprotein receptor-related protein 4 n=1 Tax=Thelohanellus kitauei TaxID=669202 RepID=A0A0C2IU15_THEKT|nr:Low-density lipoprotein receptor-related protein 4 [Thelohanellus kitauei]